MGVGSTVTSAVIGITDYAQDALGDVVYVDPPDRWAPHSVPATRSARSSRPSRCRSSTRRSAARWRPVNDDLADEPEKLNRDPYGEGWICSVTMSDPSELDGLLDAEAYQAFIAG